MLVLVVVVEMVGIWAWKRRGRGQEDNNEHMKWADRRSIRKKPMRLPWNHFSDLHEASYAASLFFICFLLVVSFLSPCDSIPLIR